MSTDPRTTTDARARRAVFIGSVIEYYDFSLYAAAATTVFATVYFPGSSPALAALQSVATFAVAFLVRPIAGAFFGSLGDRIGRKRVLIFSLILMGTATTLIGLVPSFATIGWAAPVLLVVLRVLQGIGASAEFGGATVVAVEFASTKRRGVIGSLPGSGSALGGVLGTLAMVVASASLSPEAFLSWGWRVPFLLSVVLIAYGVYLRRNLAETPAFQETAAAGRTSRRPLSEVVRSHPRVLVGVALIFLCQAGLGYFYLVVALSYATTQAGIGRENVLIPVVLSGALSVVTIPLFGWLGDRLGARVVMLGGMVATMLLAFPFFGLITPQWPQGLWLALVLGGAVANAAIIGPTAAYTTSVLPVRLRYSGIGLSRETAVMVGGAVVPLVGVQLAAVSTSTVPLSLLLCVLALLGALGIALAPRPLTAEEAAPPVPDPVVGATATDDGYPS